MRLVATSDTHKPVDVKKWIPDGDVFVHAGDLMRTGYPSDFEAQLDWLNELPHKLKLFVPGNHDFHLQVYPGPALQQLRSVGVVVVGLPGNTHYASVRLENGMTLLGSPYVTNLPRWAFNATEEQVWSFLKRMGRHDIVVSHAPVRHILDSPAEGKNVGLEAYRSYIRVYNPSHWIHGHIHECYGTERHKNTDFHNVAMCNRAYEHANPPMVIDL
jgi:Icc-related predicted phosphoesterase